MNIFTALIYIFCNMGTNGVWKDASVALVCWVESRPQQRGKTDGRIDRNFSCVVCAASVEWRDNWVHSVVCCQGRGIVVMALAPITSQDCRQDEQIIKTCFTQLIITIIYLFSKYDYTVLALNDNRKSSSSQTRKPLLCFLIQFTLISSPWVISINLSLQHNHKFPVLSKTSKPLSPIKTMHWSVMQLKFHWYSWKLIFQLKLAFTYKQ